MVVLNLDEESITYSNTNIVVVNGRKYAITTVQYIQQVEKKK